MGNPSIDAAINAAVLHALLLEDEAPALQTSVTSTHVWIAIGIVVGLTIVAIVIDQLVNN